MDELIDARPRSAGIARNAALLFAGRIVSAATTLVMLAAVGRLRGADALGVVGIGFALGSIAAAIADGGTASLLVREASRNANRAATLLMAGLAYRAVAFPVALIVVALVASVAVPGEAAAVVFVAAGLMTQSAIELTRSIFNARQRMTVSATHTILENVAWLLAILIGLLADLPLVVLFQLALAVFVASLVVGLGLDVILAGVRPRWPSAEERRTLVRDAASGGTSRTRARACRSRTRPSRRRRSGATARRTSPRSRCG
ncbi:MAG: hypothetical protein L0221_00345 [Chloroflexi bacterium]|nr:hypothetical protein [Chloroflexota bacterium]